MTHSSDRDRNLADGIGIDAAALQRRIAAIGLTPADRDRLRVLAPQVAANAPQFTERLYERFRLQPDLAHFMASDARVARLRRSQTTYLADLVSAPIDMDYALSRLRIGAIHHRIQLTPPWYISSYSHFICDHADLFAALLPDPEEAAEATLALLKSVMLDAGLVLQAYGFSSECALTATAAEQPVPGTDHAPHRADAGAEMGRPGELARLRLEAGIVAHRAAFIGIDASDRAALAALVPVVTAAAPAVMDEFYAWLLAQEETARMLPSSSLDPLKAQVTSYWHELVRADFGRPYAASRMRIGVVHHRIGLATDIYLAGLARQAVGFIRAAIARRCGTAAIKAFVKAVFFDMSFIIDACMEERMEALLHTERYASQLVAGMTAGVVVIDEAGRVQSANRAMVDMFGLEPALIYRMPVERVIPLPAMADLLRRGIAGARVCVVDIVDVVDAGPRIYRISTMALEPQDRGAQRQHAILVEDVTDVVGLVGEIGRRDAEFEAVIAATRAVVWEMERESGTILSLSRTAPILLGHRDTALLGRSQEWLSVIHEEDRAAFRAFCTDLALGTRGEIEHRMVRSDGTALWVRTIAACTTMATGEGRILGLTVDISELREAQRLRLDAASHAQRMETVSRLAGGLTHDFNNTLTVVLANLQLGLGRAEDHPAAPFLSRAMAAAELGARLNRRLLAYARQGDQSVQAIDPRARIEELRMLLEHALGDDIVLASALEPGIGSIAADPGAFDSAILNLIINARDALPGGGEVLLSVQGDDAWIEVVVQDNGAGMPPAVAARATEPFFSTKPGGTGTGLGLFMVRGFVEGSGGTLHIETAPGRGTAIRLRFPAQPPAMPEPGCAAPGETPLGNGELVLVVENLFDVLHGTVRLLEGLGYAPLAARSREDALAILRSGPVDVLLSDIVMPRGQGGGVQAGGRGAGPGSGDRDHPGIGLARPGVACASARGAAGKALHPDAAGPGAAAGAWPSSSNAMTVSANT